MKTESNKEYFVELLLSRLYKSKEQIFLQWNSPKNTNTRYFIIDKLLPKKEVEKIYNAFPQSGIGFFERKSFREKKKTSANLTDYGQILSDITYAFQDSKVVNLIAEILEMEKIEPDPILYAGGLSMMFKGDYLNPHIDNSHDSERERYRRMNLLYYVSPDWTKENGGNFELWNNDKTIPHTIVAYQNRLVIMETNRLSWHSVSKVETNKPRCCVSNYYFSKQSPDGDDYFHVTSFSGRPEEPLKRVIGYFDNHLRNIISKLFRIGRGKDLIYKKKPKNNS